VQEYRFIRPDDGRLVWVRDDCAMSLDPASGRRILLGVMFDVTGQKLLEAQLRAAEEQLQFRASHDPLTGLANRPLFDETLELALARARRNNLEVAVLFVDIDGFKSVNDAHGHDAGDEVLRIVADRLVSCARESDLVARRGGDEFLVLLPDIDPSSSGTVSSAYRGVEVADSITRRILDEMEQTIDVTLQGRPDATVTVSLSIGRCVYPWDAADATTMMAVADATMYAAKQDR
jgi:diguanylate cyclase